MTLQRPGVQSLSPTIKPFVRSKVNGKVFTLIRDDSGIGGSGNVFISRPQALSDNIRMSKEQLLENFEPFNEILMAQDPRVGRTDLDLRQATNFLTVAAKEKTAQEQTLLGDASQPTQGVTPPKRRGRPKGSKNKPKAPAAE